MALRRRVRAGASLCLGLVQVGLGVQSFWTVWDRAGGQLAERTSLGSRGVGLGRCGEPVGAPRVRTRAVHLDAVAEEDGEPLEVISPHGREYIWTRKVPALVTGTVRLGGGAPRQVRAGMARGPLVTR